MAMASHGHPSRKQPSGPLLKHFLHPIHRIGSIAIRPNGGLSSSGTQNMQSSTGQYSTQAGDPAHPVQHSVITANSLGFFFRGVASPFDFGSNLSSSGTIPTALVAPGAGGMRNYNLSQAVLRTRFLGPSLTLRSHPERSRPSVEARDLSLHGPRHDRPRPKRNSTQLCDRPHNLHWPHSVIVNPCKGAPSWQAKV